MVVLVTCKNEEDPIKNEGAVVFTPLYIDLSDSQGQITPESVVGSGRNLHSFKLSCNSLLPVRMEIKIKRLKSCTTFSHYKSIRTILDAQMQLTPQSLVDFGRIEHSDIIL